MPKKKLKWSDTEDIAFLLIDKYPSADPNKLSLGEIAKRASSLPALASSSKPTEDDLEMIQRSWYEERTDMEDELGPIGRDGQDEDEDLDEDEYRNDRMIDDEPSLGFDDDDDDDEEELGDGFHEDELSDEN